VGREYEGHVLLALHAAHQGDDLGAGVAVEIGGGLVGEHQRRCGGQGAGDGHALALAAGELWQVALAVRQAHRVQQASTRLRRSGRHARQHQRILHVLPGAEHRDQVEVLEDEADVAGRKSDKASSGMDCTCRPPR
jgi:hypothetical protein